MENPSIDYKAGFVEYRYPKSSWPIFALYVPAAAGTLFLSNAEPCVASPTSLPRDFTYGQGPSRKLGPCLAPRKVMPYGQKRGFWFLPFLRPGVYLYVKKARHHVRAAGARISDQLF